MAKRTLSANSSSELRLITEQELNRNASETSCWIVVWGHVYDVTRFLETHPGGKGILLQKAGRDATKAFEGINHSDVAEAQMQKMLIGRYAADVASSATMPAHRRGLRAGEDHRDLKHAGDEVLWSTRRRGFLPARDPLRNLEAPFDVLERLVAELPSALAAGAFRGLVDDAAPQLVAISEALQPENPLSEDLLERVHSLLGYVGKGYVSRTAAPQGRLVPRHLAAPWLAVSERLKRLPTMDYSDCVLYNWELVDPHGGFSPDNIRILNRFTGLIDEEWFMKTHVIIEAEAKGIVSALFDCHEALVCEDQRQLSRHMEWLEAAVSHVAMNCMHLMFEQQEVAGSLCDPDMFFHRFRPYISSWKAVFENHVDNDKKEDQRLLTEQLAMLEKLSAADRTGMPDLKPHREHLMAALVKLQRTQELSGPSGAMSTILPCLDAFLGIAMSSEELDKLLQAFEDYMPLEHRIFLGKLRQRNARSFILDLRLREQLRTLSDANPDPEAASLVNALTVQYNSCVRRVLDFRWRHINYIDAYVLKPSGTKMAKGTGGTPAFNYLNQHINDTEKAIIDDELMQQDNIEFAPLTEIEPPDGDLWEVSAAEGLLPSCEPISPAALPKSWGKMYELVRKLPAACVVPSTFRALVLRDLQDMPSDCQALVSSETRERAHSLLACIAAGWQAAGPPEPLPMDLQNRLEDLSQQLDCAPRIGLAGMFLYNWQSLSERCAGIDSTPRKPRTSGWRLQPLLRFVCVEEEDWFCRLHVTIAREFGTVATAIQSCYSARTVRSLVQALQVLAQGIEFLVEAHCEAGVGHSVGQEVPSVHPRMWLKRLQPFLPRESHGLPEPHALMVYCASGIDVPCLLHVLGVPKGEQVTQRYRDWQAGSEGGLPKDHREYLQWLHTQEGNVRTKIEEVCGHQLSIQNVAQLEMALNQCVDMLLRLLSRRRQVVTMVCGDNSLKKAIEEERVMVVNSKLPLLMHRRKMLEKMSPSH